MTSNKPAPISPNDAVVADLQETANILLVEKAKKAAEIARLLGIIATLEKARDDLVIEVQGLKKELESRAWSTSPEEE